MVVKRRSVTLTDEQKRRHAEIRRQVEQDKPRLMREATAYKAELDSRMEAFRRLKAEREARGLSLADVAERSGIDKSRLSKLENDPFPNPTLGTLMRIAEAIGMRLTLSITPIRDAA